MVLGKLDYDETRPLSKIIFKKKKLTMNQSLICKTRNQKIPRKTIDGSLIRSYKRMDEEEVVLLFSK